MPAMSGVTGRCQCGAVAFRCTAPVEAVYVCHCRECRRQSGSAFGISVMVPADAVTHRGEVRTWTRQADSGARVDCAFCPVCGSRLWHRRSSAPGYVTLRGGALDEDLDLTQAVEIWTARRLEGVRIMSARPGFEGEPA